MAREGPAVWHADFTPVTAARPAVPGEVLIVMANGLGPTNPVVDLGTPFPQQPLAIVNTPVEASIGGARAEVINQVGWPGFVDTYRVDVRVPAGPPRVRRHCS
jgi:uncharacterized protein (TIGR03437 family)